MKRYILLLFVFLSSLLTAANITYWDTKEYLNNQTLVKNLHIDSANKIKVKINGKTEANFDFVYIFDENNALVTKLSGLINKEIIVDGSSIVAKLISDDSMVDKGVHIAIEQASDTASNKKSWIISNYSNMENLQKRLSINGANKLKVIIKGKTEANFDILTITDSKGNKAKSLSGNLNQSFIIDGSFIDISFISDDSVTESGVTVTIISYSDNIDDKVKPSLVLNGEYPVTIVQDSKYIDKGATAYDNIDGNITSKIKIDSNVDTSKVGKYLVSYSVKDKVGNSANATREVFVVERFILNTYHPPRKTSYPDSSFNEEWRYYKGVKLDNIYRINPNNKPLFESARKNGLKYYLDIRDMFFLVDGPEEGINSGYDSNYVDYLRGERYCRDNEEHIDLNDDENDVCRNKDTGKIYKARNVDVDNIPDEKLERIREVVRKYKDDPNLLGYWIVDEPFPSVYKNLETLIKTIKEVDPKHPSIFNFGHNEWTNKTTMNQLVKITETKMFTFNHNVFWQHRIVNGVKYYGKYEESDKWNTTEPLQVKQLYKRLNDARDIALGNNTSFGYLAQLSGEEVHNAEGTYWRTPNKNELRWEAYVTMAYGGHALSWFFWEFDVYSGSEEIAWGLRDMPENIRNSMYSVLRGVNKEIFELKDIMVTLNSTNVYHNDDNSSVQRHVKSENPASPILIGEFRKRNLYKNSSPEYSYFMIVNKNYKEPLKDNIILYEASFPGTNYEYFDTNTNSWKKIELEDLGATSSDSYMSYHNFRFSIQLKAGEGRLFRGKVLYWHNGPIL